jgi:SAM-dependent methyltransferase
MALSFEIPDYETYNYSDVWVGRDVENKAERELVRKWAAESKLKENALDLGGGYGRITQVLEPYFQRVFMLDYSLNNLRKASTVLDKTTMVRCTLDSLPFEDNTFDFITLVRVMQHIPQPDRLLAEVARVGRNEATFVLGIANERFTGYGKLTQHSLAWTTPQGHRVYATPLSRYGNGALKRLEIRGVGIFDNRIGRKLRRFLSLSALDILTARLWPAKRMLFVRFRIEKKGEAASDFKAPLVRCICGGKIAAGLCGTCGRTYGDGSIIDLVAERRQRGGTP